MLEHIGLDNTLKIAALLLTIVSIYLANLRRPKVEAFYVVAASHVIPGSNPTTIINTHSLVVRNAGSSPASNVRITHAFLPPEVTIQVWPATAYERKELADRAGELRFEKLVPNEQLTISYLYPNPITYSQIGLNVKSDEGLAQIFPVSHVRVVSKWVRGIVYYLMFVGFAVSLYWIMHSALSYFGLGG